MNWFRHWFKSQRDYDALQAKYNQLDQNYDKLMTRFLILKEALYEYATAKDHYDHQGKPIAPQMWFNNHDKCGGLARRVLAKLGLYVS